MNTNDKPSSLQRLRAMLGVISVVFFSTLGLRGTDPIIVTNGTDAEFRAAVASAGTIRFCCDGTITLTDTIDITNNVTLDGSGRTVVISGNNAVRLFSIRPGASFSATNIVFANGFYRGTNGANAAVGHPAQAGEPGRGGAIYNNGGAVRLFSCVLSNNNVVGGQGGNGSFAVNTNVPGGDACGGAIFNAAGSLWLANSILLGNSATGGLGSTYYEPNFVPLGISGSAQGGAICNDGGEVLILNSELTGQRVFSPPGRGGSADGGALYQTNGTIVITNSTFSANIAQGGNGGGGGAPSSPTPAPVIARGGALYVAAGTMSGDGARFLNNIAAGGNSSRAVTTPGGHGGAIYSRGVTRFRNTAFSRNQSTGGNSSSSAAVVGGAARGGALYNEGTAALENNTFDSNIGIGGNGSGVGPFSGGNQGGSAFGGAIFNASLTLMTNCTIAANEAQGGAYGGLFGSVSASAYGGGVYSAGGTVEIVNATIVSNKVDSGLANTRVPKGPIFGANVAGTNAPVTVRNSIISGGSTNGNAWGAILDGGHNISSDATPAWPSGSSLNNVDPLLLPLADNGGPTLTMALMNGSPALNAADPITSPLTDQRGYLRPGGPAPDIGAYETEGIPLTFVNGTSEAELRAAINNGRTIRFCCDGTITLTNTIEITNNVTLDGSGRTVVISGSNTSRLFRVFAGATLTLTNLTLTDGRAASGGAILNDGTLYASDCRFVNNAAIGASGAPGTNGSNGVDSNTDPNLITEGAIGGTGENGGDAAGGVISNSGSVDLRRCVFEQNSATGGAGGIGGEGGRGGAYCRDLRFCDATRSAGQGGEGGRGGVSFGACVFNRGFLSVVDCTFAQSAAIGGSGGAGGLGGLGGAFPAQPTNHPGAGGKGGIGGSAMGAVIFNEGVGLSSNCTFALNRALAAFGGAGGSGAYFGGTGGIGGLALSGTIHNKSNWTAVNCTFMSNLVVAGGGGLGRRYNYAGCPSPSGSGGSAWGGALATEGSLRVFNSTIHGNQAVGGVSTNISTGLACWPGAGTNGANYGGNLANLTGTLTIANSILAFGSSNNCYGAITDGGHNISSDATPAWTSGTSSNNLDPLLLPLANNGGPTLTMALRIGSPALNTADPVISPATDQRGFPRPFGSGPDIGAYEGLTVPVLEILRESSATNMIRWFAESARVYRLEQSSNLRDWTPIATNTVGEDGFLNFPVSANPSPRFFRVVAQ